MPHVSWPAGAVPHRRSAAAETAPTRRDQHIAAVEPVEANHAAQVIAQRTGLSAEVRVPGLPAASGALAIVALGVALLAVRPLVPRGTLTARRGLPTVM